jgi:hypothetical protein
MADSGFVALELPNRLLQFSIGLHPARISPFSNRGRRRGGDAASQHFSGLGCTAGGAGIGQEAADICRRLAATGPDAFLLDLAKSLLAHSSALAALDRHQEAAQMAAAALEHARATTAPHRRDFC